jgi:hypothetical protein|tara:strand:+ start:394 stop:573 length:180 start_codon:yes stop_codon:yes gene_type:complete
MNIKVNKMDATSFKVYVMNLSTMTITAIDQIETALKILLLVVSIGYTIQKWWEIRKRND